jgi:hypothetical protein
MRRVLTMSKGVDMKGARSYIVSDGLPYQTIVCRPRILSAEKAIEAALHAVLGLEALTSAKSREV